jgi:hypothetical protein
VRYIQTILKAALSEAVRQGLMVTCRQSEAALREGGTGAGATAWPELVWIFGWLETVH